MKKGFVIGIFVCMLMISSALSNASFIENYKNSQDELKFFEGMDGKITTTINVGDYKIEKTENGDEISIENFGHLLIPGKPNVPTKIFSIAIPPGAIYKDLLFNLGEVVVLNGNFNIPPVSLPRVIGEEDPVIYSQELAIYNENYKTVYGSNNPYPDSIVKFERTGGYREYNLVDVRVNPFVYYPESKQVTFYSEITITISYTFPQGFNQNEIIINYNKRTERMAEKTILNYNEAKNWYTTGNLGRETYDYIIITLDSLESSIQDLVDWEEGKGRSVYVANTDWIDSNYDGYDLAEKIRNFLREKYPSDEWDVLDVCLIGDYDDVPIRRCAQSTGYGQPRTDFYYAELTKSDSESWDANQNHQWGEDSDPIDFYSEVSVGRIPWSDPDIVESICEKSAAYEQNNDPSFKKNILLIGTFFWPDTDNAVLMEAKVDQDWMEDWTMTRMYEDAQSNYECDYDVSYATVTEVWSSNTYSFVDWAGHGSPEACYEYYPSQPFVDTQTCLALDDNYPAIIFADACSNSDTDYDNIGKMMLKQGAIGFLGATQVAYGMPGWTNPMSGSSQSLDYFFTTCCTSGEYTQGEAQQYGLLQMYENNLWYYTYYETFQWGALWGNPDIQMGVVSAPPATPSKPVGPTTWTIDVAATYESTTTDPEGDSIYYLFNWGDGTNTEVGPYPSGQKGSASHIWTELGDYEVKVKARDEYGVQSDWSENILVKILENNPPGKPSITGPKTGVKSKLLNFHFIATDPEGKDVYYWISWGGGAFPETYGPYASGEDAIISHSWSTEGTHTILARTIDEYGGESIQSSYTLKITNSRSITNILLFNLLKDIIEHYPIFEKILI